MTAPVCVWKSSSCCFFCTACLPYGLRVLACDLLLSFPVHALWTAPLPVNPTEDGRFMSSSTHLFRHATHRKSGSAGRDHAIRPPSLEHARFYTSRSLLSPLDRASRPPTIPWSSLHTSCSRPACHHRQSLPPTRCSSCGGCPCCLAPKKQRLHTLTSCASPMVGSARRCVEQFCTV